MTLDEINDWWMRLQFTGAARVKLYEALGNYLENGVSLKEALDLLYNHASDDGRKPGTGTAAALEAWRKRYRGGLPFGECVRDWVPERDQILLSAGDKSDLVSALRNAAFMQQSIGRIKSAVVGGLAYPALLMTGLFTMFSFFSFSIFPVIETIVPREEWTGSIGALGVAADFVRAYIILIVAAVAGIIFSVTFTMSRWTGSVRNRFDRYPPWSLYRLVQGTGFMLALSSLIKAGIPDHEVLKLLLKNASPWYAERLRKTLKITLNGKSIGEALFLAGQNFPDRALVRELRAFSEMNRFEEMLDRMSHRRVEEDVARVKAQASIMSYVGMATAAGILGWILSSISGLIMLAMHTVS